VAVNIEISERLVELLHKHATPFVDTTPLSVVEKWADFFDQHHFRDSPKAPVPSNVPAAPSGRQFDPKRPPSLLHTRVHGEFADMPFSTWNEMLRIAHVQSFKKVGSFEELRRITRAQIRKGSYSGEGFKPIDEIGISVQGVDADHAWEYAMRLAIHLKVSIKAEVEWRNKEEAAFPGESGVLAWTP
jgi:hypothetical protein